MPPTDSFTDLMERLRAGDEDAAATVFRRFLTRLVALARVHLDSKLRQKVDAEDVVQSVFKSFFVRHAEGQLTASSWGSLWALLAVITARKCGRHVRRYHTGRRDVNQEVAADQLGDDAGVIEAFSREPSPAEAVMLSEVVEQLLRDLGARDGDILSLALQGYAAGEISERLKRPLRTVYRVLERIKTRLQQEPTEAASPR